MASPYHDDDQQEEEDLVLPHVELASLLPGEVEQDVAERVDQLQEDEDQAQDDVDQVVRTDDLPEFGADDVDGFAPARHFWKRFKTNWLKLC